MQTTLPNQTRVQVVFEELEQAVGALPLADEFTLDLLDDEEFDADAYEDAYASVMRLYEQVARKYGLKTLYV